MNRRTFLKEIARSTAGGAVATLVAGCTLPTIQEPSTSPRDTSAMNSDHDVLIIGSGPIGMIAARRLAEDGKRVMVLESGRAITTPPGSHLRNETRFQRDPDSFFAGIAPYLHPATPDADSPLPGVADSSVLGGQGILWTNNCPRAMDFERWDAMSPSQWEEKYAEAEGMLQVDPDPTQASSTGKRVQERLQPTLTADGRSIRGLPLAGRHLEDGGVYFNSPADILAGATPQVRNRIHLHSGVHVLRLHGAGNRITGVDVQDADQNICYLDVPVVLLAGGTVATPKLLYASGIRPPALGSGFSMHALLFSQLILDAELAAAASEAYLEPRLWVPPTIQAPWHLQVLRDTSPLMPTETVDNPHRLLELQAFLPVEYRLENRLEIDDDGQFHVQFAFSDEDQARMRAMEADVRRLAGQLGRWRKGCAPTWIRDGSVHLMGTCRMDRLGLDGVTDTYGKVHGLDNLYLATVGLIPVPVAVNPTLTAAALALHTCEHLIGAG